MHKRTRTAQARWKLERIAYHEAGHAVAAIDQRIGFEYVSIVPEENRLGVMVARPFGKEFRPDLDDGARTRSTIERHVLVRLAGLAAEWRLAGRHDWHGASGDLDQVCFLAGFLYHGDVLVNYVAFVRSLAHALMANPMTWARVEAVAAALLDHKHLTARQVRAICKDMDTLEPRIRELHAEELARDEAKRAVDLAEAV